MSPPNSAPVTADPTEADRWFREEVHPHDSSLKSYLRGQYPAVRDIDDVVQESYLRLWRTKLTGGITSTKSFLFQVARNVALDLLRRRERTSTTSMGEMADLPVLEEKADAADQLCYEEKVELLAAAFLSLPPRCREIMTLRKLQDMPVRDIALKLGIEHATVENQITRGVHLCRVYLKGCGVRGFRSE